MSLDQIFRKPEEGDEDYGDTTTSLDHIFGMAPKSSAGWKSDYAQKSSSPIDFGDLGKGLTQTAPPGPPPDVFGPIGEAALHYEDVQQRKNPDFGQILGGLGGIAGSLLGTPGRAIDWLAKSNVPVASGVAQGVGTLFSPASAAPGALTLGTSKLSQLFGGGSIPQAEEGFNQNYKTYGGDQPAPYDIPALFRGLAGSAQETGEGLGSIAQDQNASGPQRALGALGSVGVQALPFAIPAPPIGRIGRSLLGRAESVPLTARPSTITDLGPRNPGNEMAPPVRPALGAGAQLALPAGDVIPMRPGVIDTTARIAPERAPIEPTGPMDGGEAPPISLDTLKSRMGVQPQTFAQRVGSLTPIGREDLTLSGKIAKPQVEVPPVSIDDLRARIGADTTGVPLDAEQLSARIGAKSRPQTINSLNNSMNVEARAARPVAVGEPPAPRGTLADSGMSGPLVGRAIGRNSSQLARTGIDATGTRANPDNLNASLVRQAKVHDANEAAIAAAKAGDQTALARAKADVQLLGGSAAHTEARIARATGQRTTTNDTVMSDMQASIDALKKKAPPGRQLSTDVTEAGAQTPASSLPVRKATLIGTADYPPATIGTKEAAPGLYETYRKIGVNQGGTLTAGKTTIYVGDRVPGGANAVASTHVDTVGARGPQIFVRPGLSEADFNRVITHELEHAGQPASLDLAAAERRAYATHGEVPPPNAEGAPRQFARQFAASDRPTVIGANETPNARLAAAIAKVKNAEGGNAINDALRELNALKDEFKARGINTELPKPPPRAPSAPSSNEAPIDFGPPKRGSYGDLAGARKATGAVPPTQGVGPRATTMGSGNSRIPPQPPRTTVGGVARATPGAIGHGIEEGLRLAKGLVTPFAPLHAGLRHAAPLLLAPSKDLRFQKSWLAGAKASAQTYGSFIKNPEAARVQMTQRIANMKATLDSAGYGRVEIKNPHGSGKFAEEWTPSNLPNKIPGLGRFFEGGSAGFTMFLNEARYAAAKYINNGSKGLTSVDKAGIADRINHFTGRGFRTDTAKAQAIGRMASIPFFSPELQTSYFRQIGDTINALRDPMKAENKATLQMATGQLAATGGILFAGAALGLPIILNPTDSNFGKVDLGTKDESKAVLSLLASQVGAGTVSEANGHVYLDATHGMAGYVKALAQTIANVAGGGHNQYGDVNVGDPLANLIINHLAPGAHEVGEIGRAFLDPRHRKDEIQTLGAITPITAQGPIEAAGGKIPGSFTFNDLVPKGKSAPSSPTKTTTPKVKRFTPDAGPDVPPGPDQYQPYSAYGLTPPSSRGGLAATYAAAGGRSGVPDDTVPPVGEEPEIDKTLADYLLKRPASLVGMKQLTPNTPSALGPVPYPGGLAAAAKDFAPQSQTLDRVFAARTPYLQRGYVGSYQPDNGRITLQPGLMGSGVQGPDSSETTQLHELLHAANYEVAPFASDERFGNPDLVKATQDALRAGQFSADDAQSVSRLAQDDPDHLFTYLGVRYLRGMPVPPAVATYFSRLAQYGQGYPGPGESR